MSTSEIGIPSSGKGLSPHSSDAQGRCNVDRKSHTFSGTGSGNTSRPEISRMLSLPVDILRANVLPFLPLRTLVRLDTACCTKQLRPVYLSAVWGTVIQTEQRVDLWISCVRWSVERGCCFGKLLLAREVGEVNWRHLLSRSTDIDVSPHPWVNPARLQVVLDTVLRSADAVTSLRITRCSLTALSSSTDGFPLPAGLRALTLDENLSDAHIHRIVVQCPNLTLLHLSGTSATAHCVSSITQHCLALQDLSMMGGESFTGDHLATLAAGCPLLQKFQLRDGSNITDADLGAFTKSCPLLCELALSQSQLGDAALRSLGDDCINLTSLQLGPARSITDEGLIYLAQHCQKLDTVRLLNASLLTDTGFSALASHCPGLISIDFAGCEGVTSAALIAFSVHCPLLETVRVPFCGRIEDSGVLALAERCPALTEVVLNNCRLVTDTGVIRLLQKCPRLHELHIQACELITDATIEALAEHGAAIKCIFARRCQGITPQAITALKEKRPKVQFLCMH